MDYLKNILMADTDEEFEKHLEALRRDIATPIAVPDADEPVTVPEPAEVKAS